MSEERPTKIVASPDGGIVVPLTDGEWAEYIAAQNAPPPKPSTNPADYPLLPWQFKALVMFLGVDDQIKAAINELPAGLQQAAAMSRYENSSQYRFDDPLLQQILSAIDMPVETLADAWMQAKNLTSSS